MSELWVAAVGVVGAAAVTGYATQAGANAAGRGSSSGGRNLANEVGGINAQLGGATGDPSANALNGLQTVVGGNIDVPAFLAQHPEFQEGYDNNAGNDQAAWLRRAINDATYLDQSSIPRTGGIGTLQNTLNTQNRQGNMTDVANMAGQYSDILHSTNAGFYGTANAYNSEAFAPVAPGEAQNAATANALRGYASPLSGALNSQAVGMARPLQSWGGRTATSQPSAATAAAPTATTNPSAPQVSPEGPGSLPVDGRDPAVPAPTQGPNSDQNAMATTNSVNPGSVTPTRTTPSDTGVDMVGNPTNNPTSTTASPSDPNYWGGSALGFSDLQNQQNRIGMDLLQQGGNLSESDLRNVQQSSRAGFAARGLDATNASVVDETMNTDAARRARLIQNLSTAQGIQNQGLAETTNQQNFGLNVNQQNLYAQSLQNTALNQSAQLTEQQRQSRMNAMSDAARIQAMGNLDPYSAIINGTNPNNLNSAMGLYGQVNPSANALYGYGSDLNNTNYNAQAAANISGANNQAALYGAGIGALGRVGGAYLGNQGGTPPGQYQSSVTYGGFYDPSAYDASANGAYNDMLNSGGYGCWVAREVFGKDNPEWVQFREAMLKKMPQSFVDFYQEHGPEIAQQISEMPEVKEFIKGLMRQIKQEAS